MWGIWSSHGDEKKEADHALTGFNNREVVRESKIYGFGYYIADKYKNSYKKFTDTITGRLNKKYFWLSVSSFFSVGVNLGTHVFLLVQFITNQIILSQYTFLLGNLSTAAAYFDSFQRLLSAIYEHALYVSDLKRIFELPDIIDKTRSNTVVSNHAPKIEFRNVSFSYPKSAEKVLDGLSFVIEPGKRVALI